jgi:hypothetical protein
LKGLGEKNQGFVAKLNFKRRLTKSFFSLENFFFSFHFSWWEKGDKKENRGLKN